MFEFKLQPGNPTSKKQLFEEAHRLKSPAAQDELATELAHSHKKLAQTALQQIKDKKYHEQYLSKQREPKKHRRTSFKKTKPVTLVGCVFTVNTMQGRPVRQVTAWLKEKTSS